MAREPRRRRAAGWNLLLIGGILLLAALLSLWAWIGDSGEAPAPAETAMPERLPATVPRPRPSGSP